MKLAYHLCFVLICSFGFVVFVIFITISIAILVYFDLALPSDLTSTTPFKGLLYTLSPTGAGGKVEVRRLYRALMTDIQLSADLELMVDECVFDQSGFSKSASMVLQLAYEKSSFSIWNRDLPFSVYCDTNTNATRVIGRRLVEVHDFVVQFGVWHPSSETDLSFATVSRFDTFAVHSKNFRFQKYSPTNVFRPTKLFI